MSESERRINGQLQFFIVEPGKPDWMVGRVEKNGDRWEGWNLTAGLMGMGWTKRRDVSFATEEEAAADVRERIKQGHHISG